MPISFALLKNRNGARFSGILFFKLEEEGKLTLLLHLPKLFAETAVFSSAFGLG
jgi:hypothetical protein